MIRSLEDFERLVRPRRAVDQDELSDDGWRRGLTPEEVGQRIGKAILRAAFAPLHQPWCGYRLAVQVDSDAPCNCRLPTISVADWRERVGQLRRARQLSASSLAEKAGISRTHLWQIERRHSDPSVAVARRLAVALGVSLDVLIEEDGNV